LTIGLVLTFWAGGAMAQTAWPSQGQLCAARALADAGYEQLKAGKHEEALDQGAPENEELESDALLRGNISTGAFIRGGVIAAVSVVLFILRPGGEPVVPDAAAASVVPVIAPGWVGAQGTF